MRVQGLDAPAWIHRLQTAAKRLGRPAAFMEVCGTHTVAAFRCGLRALLPPNVKLISGPGCPVCVTSQGDVDALVELGQRSGTVLCTYGDMIKVTGAHGSLEAARARGAQIKVVTSALDAVQIAVQRPQQQVIFAAVGFETTAPATAAAVLDAQRLGLANFSILASHKRLMPAMRALLQGLAVGGIDGFLCPGHVSVILGASVYEEVVQNYRMPCVVAGFEDVQMAAGLARLTEMLADAKPAVENLYFPVVKPEGNKVALGLMDEVFQDGDVTWRGLGLIPASGMVLREKYARFDAARKFSITVHERPEPPGCRCGEVITGRAVPTDCRLFGKACTPSEAVGPCMVSSEGTCAAWFKYGNKR